MWMGWGIYQKVALNLGVGVTRPNTNHNTNLHFLLYDTALA